MQSNIKALRFLLHTGSFFDLVTTDKEALDIINKWKSGHYQKTGESVISGFSIAVGTMPSLAWAVKVESINALHTMDVHQQGIPDFKPVGGQQGQSYFAR